MEIFRFSIKRTHTITYNQKYINKTTQKAACANTRTVKKTKMTVTEQEYQQGNSSTSKQGYKMLL